MSAAAMAHLRRIKLHATNRVTYTVDSRPRVRYSRDHICALSIARAGGLWFEPRCWR